MFWSLILLSLFLIFSTPAIAQEGVNQAIEGHQEQATFNERTTRGFDPANIQCSDQDGNGWISAGECAWGSTSTPWFANPAVNTQKGEGVNPGGSGATLGQTATMSIKDGPHFSAKFYNAPSSTSTTYGMTSNPVGANLRAQHNEYGFEVVVDKKTDPLEPYYLKFYIPNTAVDSQQLNGVMSGQATGTYYKEITEENPNNPGVFNRYTVTGTFTSNANNGSSGSFGCVTGCASDPETNTWRQPSVWP